MAFNCNRRTAPLTSLRKWAARQVSATKFRASRNRLSVSLFVFTLGQPIQWTSSAAAPHSHLVAVRASTRNLAAVGVTSVLASSTAVPLPHRRCRPRPLPLQAPSKKFISRH